MLQREEGHHDSPSFWATLHLAMASPRGWPACLFLEFDPGASIQPESSSHFGGNTGKGCPSSKVNVAGPWLQFSPWEEHLLCKERGKQVQE